MINNRYLLAFSLLSLLGGCGSSDSDEDKTPVEPVEQTFSLTSLITNKCGKESAFTQVELLLQDDNWQLLEKYLPDENGVISFNVTTANINYTLVAKNQQGDEHQGLDITSFYQADSSVAAKYYGRYDQQLDNSSCECVTQDVELRHRSFTTRELVASSLPYAGFEEVDEQTTLYRDVEACRISGEAWPVQSFMVLGTDNAGDAIGAADIHDNFDANEDLLWEFSAVEVADEIALENEQQLMFSAQIIQGSKHFPLTVAEGDSSLILFNSHLYSSEADYFSQTSRVYQLKDTFFGTTLTEASHQKISSDYSQSFEVEVSENKPDVDDENFSELGSDGSYDYSGAGNYPLAVITYTYAAYDAGIGLFPVKWTSYGPDEGVLPSSVPLSGYEDVINDDTDVQLTDIELIRSMSSSDYQDYIRYYQQAKQQEVESKNVDSSDFVGDLKKLHLQINLN
ncbi:hypothetical protein [Thalassomonas actiniarum]|uniref:Lipoprotein n=1 Tax=Thalassomonas actiniarum TaxID=485447 RepID=A0AAE9YN31_9GAMM|nr:hypothetical protein [Thalassomonas actiniarum]WDD97995.1 hypothetical protein SG35_022350 [Thalassomonas actiniarum]